MWVPSGEKSGLSSKSEPLVTWIASPPAVCCTQICETPPAIPEAYASSLPSRESVAQQDAAEGIRLASASVGFSARLHNRAALMPIPTSKAAVANEAMVLIRAFRGSGLAGFASETEVGSAGSRGGSVEFSSVTGAMNRYPRRGTVSTYLG